MCPMGPMSNELGREIDVSQRLFPGDSLAALQMVPLRGRAARVFVPECGDSSIRLPRGSEDKLRTEHAAQRPPRRRLFLGRPELANVAYTLGRGRQGPEDLPGDTTSREAGPEARSWAVALRSAGLPCAAVVV